jgi:hypothetical protein
MRKLIATTLALFSLAACVHNAEKDYPPIRAGNDADSPRARDGGRAAGAGGSHAPGSTGLGAGTMGIESDARSGSTR